jgi:DNA-binding transcriptional LysR family regulator
MGHYIFPSVLKSLGEHYPEIDFNVKVSSTDQIIEDVKKGEIDAGIIFRDAGEEHESYTIIPIAMEKSVLVASSNHPLVKRAPLEVLDLKEEKFIVFSKTSNKNIIFDRFLSKNGLTQYHAIEIRNTEWIKNMVKNGIGISFLLTKIVEAELKNHTLVELALTTPLPTTPISIIIRNDVPTTIQYNIIKTMKELFYTA